MPRLSGRPHTFYNPLHVQDTLIPRYHIATVWDITDRKEREQELERQNERLQEFANVVSHDLRHPLNVVEGRLELARDECDNGHLDGVAKAHERMELLIDDLLVLARERQEIPKQEPVDLASLVATSWNNVDTADASPVTDTERTIRADQN